MLQDWILAIGGGAACLFLVGLLAEIVAAMWVDERDRQFWFIVSVLCFLILFLVGAVVFAVSRLAGLPLELGETGLAIVVALGFAAGGLMTASLAWGYLTDGFVPGRVWRGEPREYRRAQYPFTFWSSTVLMAVASIGLFAACGAVIAMVLGHWRFA